MRSKLSIGAYDEVLQLLEGIEGVRGAVFKFFAQFLALGEQIEEFDQLIEDSKDDQLVVKLGSIYWTKLGKLDQLITILEELDTQDIEVLSLLVLLRLYLNNVSKLVEDLQSLKQISNDSINYNLVESFTHCLTGQYQSAFYFFEEIEQQYPSFQNNLQSICLNLQLLQIPELQQLLEQIDSSKDLTGDLILNKITFNILNNSKEENAELISSLQLKNPHHVYLADHNAKNALFDEIVAKYK